MTFSVNVRWWRAQDSVSSARRVASKEADEILEGVCWDSPGADVSNEHHEPPFEYICEFVFVRESALESIELVVTYMAGRFHQLKVEMLLDV